MIIDRKTKSEIAEMPKEKPNLMEGILKIVGSHTPIVITNDVIKIDAEITKENKDKILELL